MRPFPSPAPRAGSLRIAFALLALTGVAACRGSMPLEESDASVVLAHQALDAPDPGLPGPYTVLKLYYGSGTDQNRAVYRDSVTLVTDSVDASKLIDLGGDAEERNEYWGFTPEGFPINGRVWYPQGQGPFPLVLVVHGNHDPRDFSDPGYDYLGELLASRGYILASVDMNFVNGGIREENDARGWLLLKHLQAWERFNEEAGSPFQGKVAMDRIALMGHSRGGEAVAHAAAFNRLTRYPDDASLEFDFGFGIRAIVAIAPVDGQYLPTGRKVPLQDVSYLTFHGSHDGDVTSFHGLRQYDRVTFTEPAPRRFKAAVYVYRANHGQWNSVWGAHDNGPRSGRILDLDALISADDQRRFAEIYVSAFLDATLKDDGRYLPLFRDHRVAGGWLPHTMYVTRFETSRFRPLVTFEEDIDVTTGSVEGVRLKGEGLSVWREDELLLRSSNRNNTSASQENQAVWLGWNGRDAAPGAPAPSYTVSLPEGLARRRGLSAAGTLQLLLTGTERIPSPPDDAAGEDDTGADEAPGDEAGGGEDREDEEKPPIALSVELEDAAGRTARVELGRYGPLRRPLETWILRRHDLEEERFERHWELMLQSFSIPMRDFIALEPRLDVETLAAVRLVFDQAEAGEVVLDELGFADLDPAFWGARVP